MMLKASDIHVSFGQAAVLRGVGMVARAGRLTAIIGPNGSGKTTFLRALTGEITPKSGSIEMNGWDISTLSPEELALRRAVLPQQSALSFPFTVAEIVRIGLTGYRGIGQERDSLIRAALLQVGLADHSGRLFQQLSGGEQQRVHLARTLVQVWQPVTADGPCWLFLDEPVSSLDIAHQLTVMRLAAGYAARGGGVVAIMHDLNLTAMFAGHVVLMQRGRAIAEGPPAQVLTDRLLSQAYDCALRTGYVPESGVWVLPQGADLHRTAHAGQTIAG